MLFLKRMCFVGLLVLSTLGVTLLLQGVFRPQPVDTSKITLTFWTLQLREFAPLIHRWIATYEKSHPNQRINWVDIPFSEGEKRSLTAMLSPNVPDVVNLNPAFASTLAQRQVLDLFEVSELEAYHPALVKLLQHNATSAYAVPWYTTTKLYFYNSALMDEPTAQGVISGQNPNVQALKRLKAKNAYTQFPLLAQGGNLLKAVQQAQTEYPSKESIQARVRYLMNPVQTGLAKGWIPQRAITGQYSDALELYLSGRLALLEAGSSAIGQFKTNAPQVYQATRLLTPTAFREDGEWVDASPMVLVVPKKSKHPAEAKAFAQYITQTTYQLELSQRAPVLPSTREGLRQLAIQTGKTLEAKALQASAIRLEGSIGILPVYPQQARLNDASNAVAQAYLLNRPKTLNHYLETLYPVLLMGKRNSY
jgi:putative chitobiose transport system substrate-binding protein